MTAQAIVKTLGEDIVKTAQLLQTRRENWKKVLDAVPANKGKNVKFPYESMAEAIKDGFAALVSDGGDESGTDAAFALLVKGYKTAAWRKLAEKNRELRDELAEGVVPEAPKAKRAKKAPKASESAASPEQA